MRAVRLVDWQRDPEVVEVPEPEPGPGQVVVKVGGAGACHSDLHLLHDLPAGLLPWTPPFTLGHENAGWVHALGEGVEGVEVGQPVAVHGAWGCGHCQRCATGADNMCEDPAGAPVPSGGGGLGLDGGMAELLLVPSARHLVELPDGLAPVDAAPLTDAGLTPYHAVRRSLPKLGPTATAVVIGVGGLGHLAVQILKATTSARVVAVDTREAALGLASRCGADAVHLAGEAPAAVAAATKGRGAEVVLDLVGSDATLAMAAGMVRPLGDLTLVGIAGGSHPFSYVTVPREASLQSTYWGSRTELAEVLELGARGLLRPTTTVTDLDGAPAAYRAMAAGEVDGRVVVVP
ncbi:MAG TPA: alcohol dehydrogenase catalytic domain-containing protein [Acidimicrobiales bacterium]|nr:alcohol dehydrogenase catalytic domain-containing protein [Acidimicrobiales bacterium]